MKIEVYTSNTNAFRVKCIADIIEERRIGTIRSTSGMPCCIIAATLIVRFIVGWKDIKAYLGYEVTDDNKYGWEEYCEFDQFAS